MPLKPGHSRDVISHNISELVKSGRDPHQAIAIALHNADEYKKKYAEGGQVSGDDSENQDDKKKTLGQIINFPGSTPTPDPTPKAFADGGDSQDDGVSISITPPDGNTVPIDLNAQMPSPEAVNAAAEQSVPINLNAQMPSPDQVNAALAAAKESQAVSAPDNKETPFDLSSLADQTQPYGTPPGTPNPIVPPASDTSTPSSAASSPSLFDLVSDKYQAAAPDLALAADVASRTPADESSSPSAAASPAVAPTTASAASPSSPMNPLLAQYLQDRQNMREATDTANKNRLIAGIAGGLGQIAASTYGADRPYDAAAFKQLEDNANLPVTALQTVQEAGMKGIQTQQALMQAVQQQEANDPNSDLSKRTRDVYMPIFQKAGLPTDGIETMSANDIKAYAQQPLEFIQKQREIEANRELQLEMAKARLAYTQGGRQNQYFQQTQQMMEQMRGNPAVQQAERDLYASAKLNRLMGQYGDLDNMSAPMAHLAMMEIARIGSGTTPEDSMMKRLNPHTLPSGLAAAYQVANKNPTPALVGGFLKEYQNYANGIRNDAKALISDRYGRILRPRQRMLNPEDYQSLQDNYVNRFTSDNPPIPTSAGATATTAGRYAPGTVVSVRGAKYQVGSDGDTLIPVQ